MKWVIPLRLLRLLEHLAVLKTWMTEDDRWPLQKGEITTKGRWWWCDDRDKEDDDDVMIRTKKTPIMWWSPQSRWWWCMDGGNSWGLPLSVGRSPWWSVVIDQLLMSTQELCTQRTMRSVHHNYVYTIHLCCCCCCNCYCCCYWSAIDEPAGTVQCAPELCTYGCVIVVILSRILYILACSYFTSGQLTTKPGSLGRFLF